MKNRSVWAGAVMVLMVVTASMIVLADFGRVGAAQDLVIKRPPPDPEPCNCPANYDPVVCVGSDGSHHQFSNACVAGCAGYTRCVGVAQPGQ